MVEISAKTTLKKAYTAYTRLPRFRELKLRALGSDFGSDWPEQQRDGARDGGELLWAADIVVRVGRDGGTFVLLYLPWYGLPSPIDRLDIPMPCYTSLPPSTPKEREESFNIHLAKSMGNDRV